MGLMSVLSLNRCLPAHGMPASGVRIRRAELAEVGPPHCAASLGSPCLTGSTSSYSVVAAKSLLTTAFPQPCELPGIARHFVVVSSSERLC